MLMNTTFLGDSFSIKWQSREVGRRPLSMKKKRYAIGTNPEKYLDELMNL